MKISNKGFLLSHLALITVAVFYGVNYFTLKAVFNEGFNNFEILGIRCAIAVVFFVGFHALKIKEKIKSRKDYLRLAICGLFGVSMNQTFFLWGLSETSPLNASVLMITVPIFVFLLAWALKQESITLQKLIGLVVSAGGAVGLTLVGASSAADTESSVLGDLLITLNACSYGLYLVLVRPLILRYNAFTITKWIFIFGSIPNITVSLFFFSPTHFVGISESAIFGIVFLILAATIGAYFLNAWAMKALPSSSVGIYIYVQPVFVALLSALLAHGGLTLLKVQFILLIFAGVFLVTTRMHLLGKKKRVV